MFIKLFQKVKAKIKVALRIKPIATHLNEETHKPKRGYSSEEKAQHSAIRLHEMTGKFYGVYLCKECNEWHIGPL